METAEIINFDRKISNYFLENRPYLFEEFGTAITAEDVLSHWDSNGPEGIGEPLTDEERTRFLMVATDLIQDARDNDLV